MVVIIVVALLVLGIAYYQVVQGMFSSLIMAVLTILSAAIAFNYYEPLASGLLYSRQPAYADAVSLVALFVLPLLALRILLDRLIRGNVVIGVDTATVWAERAVAGTFGLITGTVLVGTLLIAAQMLPFGPSVLGFRPFDDALRRDQRLVPFCPDEFTAGMMKMLSGGSLSSTRKYGDAHGDLLLDLFCARNDAGGNGRVDALPDDLPRATAAPLPPDAGPEVAVELRRLGLNVRSDKLLVVRAEVSEGARDEDGWWRLPATHFRLVGKSGRGYYPLAYLTHLSPEQAEKQKLPPGWGLFGAPREDSDAPPEVAKLIVKRQWEKKAGSLRVDWVYRLPDDDAPAYLVFRRVAGAAVGELAEGAALDPSGALERRPAPEKKSSASR